MVRARYRAFVCVALMVAVIGCGSGSDGGSGAAATSGVSGEMLKTPHGYSVLCPEGYTPYRRNMGLANENKTVAFTSNARSDDLLKLKDKMVAQYGVGQNPRKGSVAPGTVEEIKVAGAPAYRFEQVIRGSERRVVVIFAKPGGGSVELNGLVALDDPSADKESQAILDSIRLDSTDLASEGHSGQLQQQSRDNMKKLLLAILNHAEANQAWPNSIDDLGAELERLKYDAKSLRSNPLTGSDPGYEFVKPVTTLKETPASVVLLYQLKDGKRLEGGQVGFADGSVRSLDKK